MEVVLEAVEPESTDLLLKLDKMVVYFGFLFWFRNQRLVKSGDCHAALADSVSEAGTHGHVRDSNIHNDRSSIIVLGNDDKVPISRYRTSQRRQYLGTLIIHHYTSNSPRASPSGMPCKQ